LVNHSDSYPIKNLAINTRYSSESQKAHIIGEFVILTKFGGHALRHLASGGQAGREEEGREAGRLVFAI